MLIYTKHSKALTVNATVIVELAKSSKTDQDMMLNLTREAKKDSGTMKLIAIVTMIYLPSSLVTVCCSPDHT